MVPPGTFFFILLFLYTISAYPLLHFLTFDLRLSPLKTHLNSKPKKPLDVQIPWAKMLDPYSLGVSVRTVLTSPLPIATPPSTIRELYEDPTLLPQALPLPTNPSSSAAPPEVLVVGATSQIGIQVVSSLKRSGFAIRVLLPNLYSSTISPFGLGVSFTTGDLSNPSKSALEYAVTEIDKIIFCGEEDQSPEKIQAILRTLMDTRFADYGITQSPTRILFNFKKPNPRYSKRNDHKSFAIQESAEGEGGVAEWQTNRNYNGVFKGTVNNPNAAISVMSGRLRGSGSSSSIPGQGINLNEFNGLLVGCFGDGKTFECVLKSGESTFVSPFRTKTRSGGDFIKPQFMSHILPFDSFKNANKSSIDNFDPNDVRQIGFQFKLGPSPLPELRKFYLAISYVKVIRKIAESDIVLVGGLRETQKENEIFLRNTGLTHTIVSTKNVNAVKNWRKLADLSVNCLTDPRSTNKHLQVE